MRWDFFIGINKKKVKLWKKKKLIQKKFYQTLLFI